MACGALSMHVATECNYRTTVAAKKSIGHAFNIAFKAGTVMGFAVVSIALVGKSRVIQSSLYW
jgi:Na+/H+-translocating membrane pyrophosphatase